MSKQKNERNGVAVLDPPAMSAQPQLRINWDEIDTSVETVPVEVQAAPAVETPVTDSEEAILATVETFDSTFAGDPLVDKYREFATAAKEYTDRVDDAVNFVRLSTMEYNIMVAEHKLAPGSYERAKVMKKCETALRVAGVRESMVRPQEVAALLWVVKLDRSTPGGEGEARTFAADDTPSDWFGGNLTLGVLRVLAKLTSRVSKDGELDLWEYKDGYEMKSREWINRLRKGELSIRMVEKLIGARKKQLTDERKAAKYQGLTPAEIESIESAEKNATHQAKLKDLGSQALTLQKFAAEELKKGKADLRDFLVNTGVIPPEKFVTAQEYAAQMTPGDAKALVQELIRLYPTKPDRLVVFKTLYSVCKAVVDQIKSAQEQAQPMKKTG
jgi:hypothetical protein